ncbi:MAG: hypothetical protein U0166_15755 [Acidobacteriota bacterium]
MGDLLPALALMEEGLAASERTGEDSHLQANINLELSRRKRLLSDLAAAGDHDASRTGGVRAARRCRGQIEALRELVHLALARGEDPAARCAVARALADAHAPAPRSLTGRRVSRLQRDGRRRGGETLVAGEIRGTLPDAVRRALAAGAIQGPIRDDRSDARSPVAQSPSRGVDAVPRGERVNGTARAVNAVPS